MRFQKVDRYHLLETNPLNAEPYGNPNAYRLEAHKSSLSESMARDSPKGDAVIFCVSKRGFIPSAENAADRCGIVRKFRYLPPESAQSALPDSRGRYFPNVAAVIFCVFKRGFLTSSANTSGKCGIVEEIQIHTVWKFQIDTSRQYGAEIGDFYPLLKTQLLNAALFENSDAYRLKAQNRHFRKVGAKSP